MPTCSRAALAHVMITSLQPAYQYADFVRRRQRRGSATPPSPHPCAPLHPSPPHAFAAQALRLCPCTSLKSPKSAIHDAVAAVVTQQLQSGQANVFIGRQYDASKGHASICQGAQCPSSDALKTFDLTTLGLPSNKELLQSVRLAHGRAWRNRSSSCSSGTTASCFRLHRPAPAATTTALPKCCAYSLCHMS